MSQRTFVYDDFADKIGTTFVLAEANVPPVPFKLVECTLLDPRQAPPGGRPPFTLIFVAQTPQMLPQRLYNLTQEAMGDVELFLVPVGKDARGFHYEALFN